MTDRKTLDKARDWTIMIQSASDNGPPIGKYLRAATEVIRSLPDSWVDADKVRDILAKHHPSKGGIVNMRMWESLQALLPSPPRRPAMIKRGALAVHPEHGEVLVISNWPKRNGDVEIVWDSEYTEDGTYWTSVPADSLTAPDELADSGTPETNNEPADDEEVDDSPEFDKTRKYRDRRGGTWEWDNDEHAWRRDFDGPMGETIYLDNLTDFSEYGPYTVVDESVPPTRDFPQGAHYDSEGNATEPHQVPAGEAWLVQTRYHDEPVPAFKRNSGTWVFIDRLGLSTWDYDRNIELIAPLVPKPEPRVLGTFKDYQDAAIGTIVRVDDPDTYFNAWKKTSANLWQSTAGYTQDNNEMSGTSRTTIWEPEEADQ